MQTRELLVAGLLAALGRLRGHRDFVAEVEPLIERPEQRGWPSGG
ncbi:MAG: hypothetical protein U0836_26335 [Pirellulales bacterium]